jgi:hypothetical protein
VFSTMLDHAMPGLPQAAPAHILLVVADRDAREELADALLDAGFWLTVGPTFGLGTMLRDCAIQVDLVITALPMAELVDDGAIRLARTIAPDVPLLMLEESSVSGPGVVAAVQQMLRRWPSRQVAS